jgi:predicted nucleic acid-binding protein
MKIEPGVLDANILVYAMDVGAQQHAVSLRLLQAAADPTTVLYLTSQILCEFYSVVTNPRRIAVPYSLAEAHQAITGLLGLPGTRLLRAPQNVVRGWLDLLQRHPVGGSAVFDLQIVATMLANGIQRIYTFNPKDFEVFPELTVIAPSAVP